MPYAHEYLIFLRKAIYQLTECSIALAVQKLIERAIEKIKETVATP
ncbi:hypothetical protein QUB04_23995 [Microcoleus sp. D2_18a_B4]